MDKRNDIARWLILALICGAGSTGGAFLRPHNPGITTESWIKMLHDVESLRNNMVVLSEEVRALIRRVPRQP